MESWRDEAKVSEYLGRVARLDARRAGEVELVEAMPPVVTRALDLGCGDGRLMQLVLDSRPQVEEVVGLDVSPPMLQRADERFRDEARAGVCATPELHEEFNRRIGRPGGDPEDRLVDPEVQLGWMRAAGLHHVDCAWRWRGFALLVGRSPSVAPRAER